MYQVLESPIIHLSPYQSYMGCYSFLVLFDSEAQFRGEPPDLSQFPLFKVSRAHRVLTRLLSYKTTLGLGSRRSLWLLVGTQLLQPGYNWQEAKPTAVLHKGQYCHPKYKQCGYWSHGTDHFAMQWGCAAYL